ATAARGSGDAAATAAAAGPGANAAAASAHRGGDLQEQVARRPDEGARRRLLRSRQVGDPRGREKPPAEERRLDEEVDEHAGQRRGTLRLARQRRVQPRPRFTPGHRRERVSDQSGRAGEPCHRGEQRQGTAGLQRGWRILLAEESPRTFCGDSEVETQGRTGWKGRKGWKRI